MRIIALKRPPYPEPSAMRPFNLTTVNGPHGLRRAVEKLLPEFYPLHSGLTTGTCATAAAVAQTLRLKKGKMPDEVPVVLPNGETINVSVGYGDNYAFCIKEAGDDPDVTNGIEVRASITLEHRDTETQGVIIKGGEGVGRFTLPGFDYPPGEAAINKAPREMIRQNLERLCISESLCSNYIIVTISVPQGDEISRRTFNPRLGIEGGISIIGVSGIVKPFSEEAFIDSIRKCMTVAKASGSERVVINSGGKSERFVKALYPTLPQQAFVEYGNYIGETLKIAHELNLPNITLGVMLGKAVKLAAGHLDTHSKRSTMDKIFISEMLHEANINLDISHITLAREIWERLSPEKQQDFANVVISHCATYCKPLLPNGELTILLIADDGTILPQSQALQPEQ
jgi:cobalt-precorrin-5B (C1)-methyltransferase